ncbi:uncharacterized protein LOC135228623 [Loxodonta africana]|uniref:uncharacterized protein LOC135228623 n=1 Tax=Loxodonta africana TaxID=9785 RepID=UPI0030D17093
MDGWTDEAAAWALGGISADVEPVWRPTPAVSCRRARSLGISRHPAPSRAFPRHLVSPHVAPRCRLRLQVMLDSTLDEFAGSTPASTPFSPVEPDPHSWAHSHSPGGEDVPWDCQLAAVVVPRGPVSGVFKESLDHDAWKVGILGAFLELPGQRPLGPVVREAGCAPCTGGRSVRGVVFVSAGRQTMAAEVSALDLEIVEGSRLWSR